MPNNKYRILSTKPLSQEQLQLAAAHSIAVEEQAFIDIVPVKNAAVNPAFKKGGTFVFSSPNAVKSVVEQLDDRSGKVKQQRDDRNGDVVENKVEQIDDRSGNSKQQRDDLSGDVVKNEVEQIDDRSGDVMKSDALQQEDASLAKNASSKSITRVYCIQGATKQAVEALLPEAAIIGIAPNSKELAELMLKDMEADAQLQHNILKDISHSADAVKDGHSSQSKNITFCCGNIRRDELPDMLRNAGITVNEIVVYETHETPKPLSGTYDGIMFFSPSSVRSFFTSNALPANTICFAIGHTTGAALQERTASNVVTSPEASVDALLQTVILHFDNIK